MGPYLSLFRVFITMRHSHYSHILVAVCPHACMQYAMWMPMHENESILWRIALAEPLHVRVRDPGRGQSRNNLYIPHENLYRDFAFITTAIFLFLTFFEMESHSKKWTFTFQRVIILLILKKEKYHFRKFCHWKFSNSLKWNLILKRVKILPLFRVKFHSEESREFFFTLLLPTFWTIPLVFHPLYSALSDRDCIYASSQFVR